MKKPFKLLLWMIPVAMFAIASCEKSPDDPEPEPEPDPTPVNEYAYYSQFSIPSGEDNLEAALAFPGAEGGGMYTTGGRGGTVYHVTTLEDNSSSGSLRYACSQSGKRIIVFDVAGTIKLTKALKISNGDLTILGQTAPGTGICIAYDQVNIQADNVIIRFVHFRCSDYGGNSDLSDSSDALWGRFQKNIILDHCTMSWSIDECASFYANQNFTMQWCMIYEGLNNSAYHDKSGHGYGGLWGGKNASFHHNLLAHNNSRNARIDHPGIYSSYLTTHRGNVDYRNNVIYNWADNNTYGGEDGWFNIVGNYYKPGPASADKNRKYIVDAYWDNGSSYSGDFRSTKYPELYMSDNYKTDGWDYDNGVMYHDQASDYGANPDHSFLTSPLSIKADDATTCYVTTHSYSDAFNLVVKYAGPSLSRDDCDARVAQETQNGTSSLGTNGIIDTMEGVNYFPELTGEADVDSDGDGMPDWFEEDFGLDTTKDDSAGYDLDKYSRYTNIEMYAHYLVKDIVKGQTSGGTYTALD